MKVFLQLLAAVVLAMAGPAAFGAPAAPSVEALFEHPRHGRAELSPDTRLLAVTAKIGAHMRLVVIDLESGKAKPVASFDDVDIGWFTWINNRRLLLTVEDRGTALGEQPGAGLFAVDADGGEPRELIPTFAKEKKTALIAIYRGGRFLSRLRGSDDIHLLRPGSDRKGFLVMRMNTRNGRETSAVVGVEGHIIDAAADASGELRALMTVNKTGQVTAWHRAAADRPWESVASFSGRYDRSLWWPVGFSADGRTMWVSAHRERDLAAVYPFDLASKTLGEAAIRHPTADLTQALRFDIGNGDLLGVEVETDARRTDWIDPDWERAQAAADRALPNRINRLSGDVRKRLLVLSHSERDPGRYYLFDARQGKLAEQFAIRPEIDPAALAETKMIHYEARDGLRIPAFLTLPPGAGGQPSPLVVLIHGGPYMRDYRRFNPEVQLLATRGYAVLQPQFRGSTGFGNRLFRAGWKTWGLAMQDDVTDGVKALVAQGVADERRVCLMGGSYGGYATLMGLAKEPDMFRCGVAFAAVTDIRLMYSVGYSDFAESLWADFGMKEQIGDPEILQEQFIATSPVEQARRIKAPVLLAHAGNDHRVPPVHGEKMRDALRAAGKSFEWQMIDGEGHGLMKAENRIGFYRSVEAFLHKALSPETAVPARP